MGVIRFTLSFLILIKMLNMELKEFVKETLLQITEGVKEAQEAVKEYGAAVNPMQYQKSADSTNAKLNNEYYPVQNIDFEVALTSSNDGGTKKGIGVLLGNLSIGANKSEDNKTMAVTNIRFSVPIVLPADNTGNDKRNGNKTIYVATRPINKHRY